MEKLYRRAMILAWVTVLYNLIEGAVSIAVAYLAGSIALKGFGLDSFIESLSGRVVIWRLRLHGRVSAEEEERLERRAARLVGITFFILAADVLYESAHRLLAREAAEPTLFGIAIAAVSIALMVPLFYAKFRTGSAVGSRSLVADSKETLACAFLSVVLLVGLGANYLWRIWWADPAAGVVIAVWLVREGWETLRGEEDEQ